MGGLQYRPQKTDILIIGTPKSNPNFGKPPYWAEEHPGEHLKRASGSGFESGLGFRKFWLDVWVA